jgi:hypothetical protein
VAVKISSLTIGPSRLIAYRATGVAPEGFVADTNSFVPNQNLVVSDPEILSGEPVFAGTRNTIDTVLASMTRA